MLIPSTRRRMLRPATDYSFQLIARSLADIVDAGGYGAIGSHGQQHGLGSHWEVWMAATGMGPMRALEVGTLHGAKYIGIDGETGSIKAGKLADLLVLNSNPLDNIRNTLDMQYVMKGGMLHDAMSLDQLWPKAVPFGPAYWVNDDALKTDVKSTTIFDKKP